MGRTIVVGDVHGCLAELQDLLEVVAFADEDRLVFVGDLVAKGPNSRGVVRLAMNLGADAVLGNHECKVLCIRGEKGDWTGGKVPEFRKEQRDVAASFDEEQVAWMSLLPTLLRLPEHNALVVHGGLNPAIALDKQSLTVATTTRSILDDGTPSKDGHSGRPWASLWKGPDEVIFGHDAAKGLQRYQFAVGLDTGCVYGGELSAYLLPERSIVSVPARRDYCQVGS